MRTYAEQRAMLARMERTRSETERQLAIIENQIAARAERMTVTSRVKSRQNGRSTSTWTRAERTFQENVAALRFERRGEIETLTRKLARQTGAIAAFRVRHRINEPTQERAS